MLALLLMQEVAGPPVPSVSRPFTVVTKPCTVADDGADVVVCARHPDPPRLVKLPERYVSSPQDMATFRLPGHATGNVHGLQNDLAGATSQGVAVTLKIPFGSGKKG